MDLNAIRKRLGQLQTTNNRTSSLWKPQPGKTQIRIVPYAFNKDNPFIELFFHYNLNNRSYLSPISFGRPDPIEEFAQKLKASGNKEDYLTNYYYDIYSKEAKVAKPNAVESSYDTWLREEARKKAKEASKEWKALTHMSKDDWKRISKEYTSSSDQRGNLLVEEEVYQERLNNFITTAYDSIFPTTAIL